MKNLLSIPKCVDIVSPEIWAKYCLTLQTMHICFSCWKRWERCAYYCRAKNKHTLAPWYCFVARNPLSRAFYTLFLCKFGRFCWHNTVEQSSAFIDKNIHVFRPSSVESFKSGRATRWHHQCYHGSDVHYQLPWVPRVCMLCFHCFQKCRVWGYTMSLNTLIYWVDISFGFYCQNVLILSHGSITITSLHSCAFSGCPSDGMCWNNKLQNVGIGRNPGFFDCTILMFSSRLVFSASWQACLLNSSLKNLRNNWETHFMPIICVAPLHHFTSYHGFGTLLFTVPFVVYYYSDGCFVFRWWISSWWSLFSF